MIFFFDFRVVLYPNTKALNVIGTAAKLEALTPEAAVAAATVQAPAHTKPPR